MLSDPSRAVAAPAPGRHSGPAAPEAPAHRLELERRLVFHRRAAVIRAELVHQGGYVRFVKPVLDRLIAFVVLLLIAPFVLLLALIARVKLGRGVIFKQDRVGQGAATFRIFKFRSMLHDRRTQQLPFVGPDRRVTHKSADDPRHTPFGRTLRKWSLDEIPQLWNVLRGEMSLVGPRPELVDVVERYGLWDHPRHLVKPGLTGVWQISEHRSELLHQSMWVDFDYLERITFWGDLKVVLRTPLAVLRSRGA
ncbi:MAG: sugar transferase [Acidimicrobiales bacterium]